MISSKRWSGTNGLVQKWLFEHYLKLSNICVLVTVWMTATDRVALLVDSSIAVRSLLPLKQYDGSES